MLCPFLIMGSAGGRGEKDHRPCFCSRQHLPCCHYLTQLLPPLLVCELPERKEAVSLIRLLKPHIHQAFIRRSDKLIRPISERDTPYQNQNGAHRESRNNCKGADWREERALRIGLSLPGLNCVSLQGSEAKALWDPSSPEQLFLDRYMLGGEKGSSAGHRVEDMSLKTPTYSALIF